MQNVHSPGKKHATALAGITRFAANAHILEQIEVSGAFVPPTSVLVLRPLTYSGTLSRVVLAPPGY
jgi:hypothetical protein